VVNNRGCGGQVKGGNRGHKAKKEREIRLTKLREEKKLSRKNELLKRGGRQKKSGKEKTCQRREERR